MSFDSPPVVECSEICFILICNVRESFHKLNCLFFYVVPNSVYER